MRCLARREPEQWLRGRQNAETVCVIRADEPPRNRAARGRRTSRGFRTGSFGKLAYFYELCADELRLDLRFAILEKHRQNFTQIRI